MAGTASVELAHCRELAILPGSMFEFTSRFLRADQFDSVLALYALRQAIVSIPHGPQDDSVKWAKLRWWGEELLADPDSPARHPVIRALSLSGARANLENALLLGLVNHAAMQIEATPLSDENALFERFSELGSTETQLELALENAAITTQNLEFLAAASVLFRMVSSFAPGHRSETERIPLNILAKHNAGMAQIHQNESTSELTQIIEQLAGIGLDWFSRGMSGLKVSSPGAAQAGACGHLRLRWAMEKRRLEVIQKDAIGFMESGKQYGPADAWFAWKYLRRLT